jgi:hypothetical protein
LGKEILILGKEDLMASYNLPTPGVVFEIRGAGKERRLCPIYTAIYSGLLHCKQNRIGVHGGKNARPIHYHQNSILF